MEAFCRKNTSINMASCLHLVDILQLRGGAPDYCQFTLRAVVARLAHKDEKIRVAAVEALANITKKGDNHIITTLIGHLEDFGQNEVKVERGIKFDVFGTFRKAIVETLAQVSEKGDQHVIATLCTYMDALDEEQDFCGEVREAAVKALAQVAEKGDDWVITTLIGKLERDFCTFENAIVETLAQVSEKGDQHVIATLCTYMDALDEEQDVRGELREAAVKALAQVAEKGDDWVITTLIGKLEGDWVKSWNFDESDEEVLEENASLVTAVVEALSQVAEKVDQSVVAIMFTAMSRVQFHKCEAAVAALAQVQFDEEGHQYAITALTTHFLGCETLGVRVAVHALVNVGGEAALIAAVTAALRDAAADATAKLNAIAGLICDPQIIATLKGNLSIIRALVASLGCSDLRAAGEAVGALAQLAEKGDVQVVTALVARLGQGYGDDRTLTALVKLAEKGDPQVITALVARLGQGCGDDRRTLTALVKLAEKGKQVVDILTKGVLDSSEGVAEAARQTVREFDGRCEVIAAVKSCFEHSEDPDFRGRVLMTLAHIAKGDDQQDIEVVIDGLIEESCIVRKAAMRATLDFEGKNKVIAAAVARWHEADPQAQCRLVRTFGLIQVYDLFTWSIFEWTDNFIGPRTTVADWELREIMLVEQERSAWADQIADFSSLPLPDALDAAHTLLNSARRSQVLCSCAGKGKPGRDLSDESDEVLCFALMVIAQIAGEGDQQASNEVLSCLDGCAYCDYCSRKSRLAGEGALTRLGINTRRRHAWHSLTQQGIRHDVEGISKGVSKGVSMAMGDLAHAASKGNNHSIRTVVSYLGQGCRHGKGRAWSGEAGQGKGCRHGKDYRDFLAGLAHTKARGGTSCDDDRMAASTAAFTALAEIAEGGDPHAIAALTPFVAMSRIVSCYS